MMVLYYILCTIAVIFGILSILTTILLASGDAELMLLPIIVYIIFGLSICGCTSIEAKHDKVAIETVQSQAICELTVQTEYEINGGK